MSNEGNVANVSTARRRARMGREPQIAEPRYDYGPRVPGTTSGGQREPNAMSLSRNLILIRHGIIEIPCPLPSHW